MPTPARARYRHSVGALVLPPTSRRRAPPPLAPAVIAAIGPQVRPDERASWPTVCAALLGAALALTSCRSHDAWRADVAAWRPGQPVPSFPLVDQDGQAFELGDVAGPVAVGFVYTHCPVETMCPLTMKKLAEARRDGARVLVVTLDPARDTPAALRAYAARFAVAGDAGFTLATGAPDVVEAFASLFNVYGVAGADGAIAHPVRTALLDARRVPVHTWADNTFSAKEIVDESARQ